MKLGGSAMSEKSLFIQATDIIRARDERIAALEAEVAQNETDLLRLNDLLDTAEAERDALRAVLRELVRGIDSWEDAVGQIIERPVNHRWKGLEEARVVLRDTAPPEEKP